MSIPNIRFFIFSLDMDGSDHNSGSQLEIQSQDGENFTGILRQPNIAETLVTGTISEGSAWFGALPNGASSYQLSFQASNGTSTAQYTGALKMVRSNFAFIAGTFTDSQNINFGLPGLFAFPAGGRIVIQAGPFPFCAKGVLVGDK